MCYLILFIATFINVLSSQVIVDTTFNFSISYPTILNKKIRVAIDASHYNLHTANGGFRPLAKLLKNDGYDIVDFNKKIVTVSDLEGIDIFITANARPENRTHFNIQGSKNAYKEDEISVLKKWVSNGGSLLIIADHMPFAGAAENLIKAFDFNIINGFVGYKNQWPPNIFNVLNGTLQNNFFNSFMLKVDSLATYTGSAFQIPKKAYNILKFNHLDTLIIPDTAWVFRAFNKKINLENFSQGSVLEFGKGKVSIFGEAAMFTAQILTEDNLKVGLNNENYGRGNILFVLNLFHYLSNLSLLNFEQIEKQSIINNYKLMDTYFNNNQMSLIANLYSDSALVIGNYFSIKGKNAIKKYWEQLNNRGIRLDHSIESLEIINSVAIQYGISELEYKKDNTTIINKVRYTLIWEKDRNHNWLISRDHYTLF